MTPARYILRLLNVSAPSLWERNGIIRARKSLDRSSLVNKINSFATTIIVAVRKISHDRSYRVSLSANVVSIFGSYRQFLFLNKHKRFFSRPSYKLTHERTLNSANDRGEIDREPNSVPFEIRKIRGKFS